MAAASQVRQAVVCLLLGRHHLFVLFLAAADNLVGDVEDPDFDALDIVRRERLLLPKPQLAN
jgi:hypothetical protein